MTDHPASGDPPADSSSKTATSATPPEAAGAAADAPATAAAEYTTDRRTLSARVQVQWAVPVLVLTAILGVGGWALAPRAGLDPVLAVPAAGALAVAGLAWVHLRFRVWEYRLRDDALYLQRGVFRHVRTVAPHVRIQHVDTSRGPIERALGLSTLVVYTAGSRGADVSVPGLTPEEAADLQTRVKELAIAAEGGDAV
jgi:hypothetical protein